MKRIILTLLVAIGFIAPLLILSVEANAITCPAGQAPSRDGKTCQPMYVEDCPPGQDVSQDAPVSGGKYVCCPIGTAGKNQSNQCFFAKYINPTVKLLTALAGVAAVLGISLGGIQYASSGGDPQKTAAGKAKVTKALYGLVGFMFLFSALQFMSPGGFSAKPAPSSGTASAKTCSKPFFGLKPWFAYLPATKFDANCQIKNFNLLPSEGDPKSTKDNTSSDLLPVILAIVDNLVRIAALVAIAFVIIGGIKYVISQGEPEGIKSAKDSIINALIGLVIAIIAASVVSFIGNQLT